MELRFVGGDFYFRYEGTPLKYQVNNTNYLSTSFNTVCNKYYNDNNANYLS